MSPVSGEEPQDVSDAFLETLRTHLYFEISWEVANKVGGIYTVLRSKAALTTEQYGSRYFLVGIFDPSRDYACEVEEGPLQNRLVQRAIAALRNEGLTIHTGTWLVEGNPQIILFGMEEWTSRCAEFRSVLWQRNGIPAPPNDYELDSCIVFGFLLTALFRRLLEENPLLKMLAHFHEWLTGVGIIQIKNEALAVATVFTTHATILGRHLCAGQEDFYNRITKINVDEEAGKRGIYPRYCVERAAAHSCNVFTSVSRITAYEAEWLLGRKPDGVLPNGLSIKQVNNLQALHQASKSKIDEFVRAHFYGHLKFIRENVLYFFIAGRYEYRNKGFDIFIEALARLNARLKHFNSNTTVVAFIVLPGRTSGYGVETLKGQALLQRARESVRMVRDGIEERLLDAVFAGSLPKSSELVLEADVARLKTSIGSMKRELPPPVTTHVVQDDANDPVLCGLRACNLCNWDSDRVKVVYHPEFIYAQSPILPLGYAEFVRGCHLGIFPSYYEPWGYTPAECAGLGVASVTTNLSGFGSFLQESQGECDKHGIFVLDRRSQSVEGTIQQLVDYMIRYCQLSKKQRKQLRVKTERLSAVLDWRQLGQEYEKARRRALYLQYSELQLPN